MPTIFHCPNDCLQVARRSNSVATGKKRNYSDRGKRVFRTTFKKRKKKERETKQLTKFADATRAPRALTHPTVRKSLDQITLAEP